MKILTTPWKNDLLELVANAKHSIKITSPFVKEEICREIIEAKQSKSDFELITSFKLMSIYSGSLDLSALEIILSANGTVKNFSKLHSKVYLFDDKKAVITSGNLTSGGLLRNYEYGVLIDDKSLLSEIQKDFQELSDNVNTGTIKKSDLESVRNILADIPKNQSIKLPSYSVKTESPEQIFDVIELPSEIITKELSGWKLDVFNCLNNFSQQQFTLTDAYSSENYLRKLHPQNNNVRDKIRQQLQVLRDLGLIEFLGYGNYKKLWK
jgi:hypothetical protein